MLLPCVNARASTALRWSTGCLAEQWGSVFDCREASSLGCVVRHAQDAMGDVIGFPFEGIVDRADVNGWAGLRRDCRSRSATQGAGFKEGLSVGVEQG